MSSPATRPFTVGVAVVLVFLAYGVLFAYATHAVLPFNPVVLPFEQTSGVRYWAPQGWKFFTRDPREDWILAYERRENGAWRLITTPNATLENLFGIGRRSRARGIELGRLMYGLQKKAWIPCESRAEDCLENASIAASLDNANNPNAVCGTIGIVLQQQVPWAWAKTRKIPMPSRVIKLKLKC